jgi:rubrerythrin
MSDNMLNILSNMDKLQGGRGVDLQESTKPVHNAESAILEALSRIGKEPQQQEEPIVDEEPQLDPVDESVEEPEQDPVNESEDAQPEETDIVNEAKIVEPEQEVGDVHIPSDAQVKDIEGAGDVPEGEHQHPEDAKDDEVEDEAVVKGAVNQCRACGAFHQLAQCPVCGGENHDFFGDVIDCDEAEGQDEF